MAIRLCDEDRERLGTPESLEFDLRAISVGDMEFLSERFGFDPEDWPEPFVGQLTFEQAGDPDAKPKPPPWRNHAFCWMLLRQNGIDVSWEAAATVRYFLITIDADPDREPSPGKETPEPSPSPDSDASTTPPSATSTD